MTTQTQTTSEQAIVVAKTFLLKKFDGYVYPIAPTDEDGNELPYDSGCVPHGSCHVTQVVSATCESETEEHYIINVDLEWIWSDGEEEEDEREEIPDFPTFEVTVYKDGLSCDDDSYERID